MNKLIIISNELPCILTRNEDYTIGVRQKPLGLYSSLESFYEQENSIWIGQPGIDKDDFTKSERNEFGLKLEENNCYPIYVSKKDREKYLEGFSNRTLWPLFHYFTQNAIYRKEYWEGYVLVNQIYTNKAISLIEEGDKVWIHDYHLMLVPLMIREKFPNVSIGFFLHIPFPSYEIFLLLPWRTQILEGLLGADLIGFHTYDYERHFMSCVRRLLGYDSIFNRIHMEERIVKVDFFPLGIDYQKFSEKAKKLTAKKDLSIIQKDLLSQQLTGEGKKLILSVDRLDYTKGIPLRLKAYKMFLEANPEYHEKVSLLLYVMPSRESVEQYKILKRELNELVGHINSLYGSINWMPIWYFYRQLDFEELTELYAVSDIALIIPIRDGMNLIAKEFIAAKTDGQGVLILSEMAGASKEMNEAIIVNPNNRIEIAQAIKTALEMPQDEQIQRNQILQERLKRYNDVKWASDFLSNLKNVKKIQEIKLAKKITQALEDTIQSRYLKATSRILFLDYDGTLVGFHKDPQKAHPDEELYDLLRKLAESDRNKVAIISGRDKETLSKWFPPDWKITFIAEHGVWSREPGNDWGMLEPIDQSWMEIIRQTLEFYVDRTPKSFIERKNYSLVWHYRNADPDLGVIRSWELKDELKDLVTNLNLEIMDGDKVIEIKNSGINKGRAALQKMGNQAYDFIFAIGDDWTDEYTFDALPEDAITIKVGTKTTKADYYVESVRDIRNLLKSFTESGE